MTAIREQKAKEAAVLRRAGLPYREIGERLGVSAKYAADLVYDPTGSNARARKTKGVCIDCGKPCRSDHRTPASCRRCRACSEAHNKATAKWTREAIVAAIQRWAEVYGEPPVSTDWNVAQSTPLSLDRYRAGDYPTTNTVQNVFGGWGQGVEAAGFEAKFPLAGRPRNKVSDETYEAMLSMKDSGASYSEVAERFGINQPAAYQRIRQARAKRKGVKMSASISAQTILEREIERFKDRIQRHHEGIKEAEEQIEHLKIAVAAVKDGKPDA